MRHAGLAGVAILISTWLAPAVSVAVEYTVTTVPGGQCPDEVCDILRDINDVGQTLLENAVIVPGDHVESYGLNNAGEIVGLYLLPASSGFIKSGGVITKFAVPGASFTTAIRINNRGDIVGYARVGGKYRSFVRAPDGSFTTLQFPGADDTFATGINDGGHIVGIYRQGATSKSFLKQGEMIRTMTTPAPNCEAQDINDLGQILGGCYELKPGNLVPTSVRVFVKHGTADDAPVDLLVFGSYETEGLGINNVGQIVGVRADIGARPSNYIATPQLGPTAVAAAVLPSSRAVQVDQTATVFATLLASGPGTATGCTIAPTNAPEGTAFTYQQTNAQNVPIGTPNTPADIPGGQGQSFVLSLTPNQAFAAMQIEFAYDCANTNAVAVIPGVNTLELTSSSTPTPDIVALAATVSKDGIVTVPVGGAAAFAVATVNVGASAAINVSTDFGDLIFVRAPATVTLCQTNPTIGVCLAPPTFGVTTQIDAGATATYAIFAEAELPIGFDPARLRVYVRFKTQAGGTVGSTSVAVRTQ